MGKILLPTLLVLTLSIVMVLAGTASPTPVIAQTNPTTTIYLDPSTVNGTAIGVNNTVTINIRIRDAPNIQGWQAGMIFNPDLLNCTGFFEGKFLSDFAGPLGIYRINGTIDNTAGVITAYSRTLLGEYYASGSGQLANATFKVKAPGVSNLHLRDVKVSSWEYVDTTPEKVKIPTNIIDVYTVIVDTTSHTVITVSNSTGTDRVEIHGTWVELGSNFTGHTYDPDLKEISFNVTCPYPSFSNITIPKVLLRAEPPRVWTPVINDRRLGIGERVIAENETHTSIYFTYSFGINIVQVTSRFMPSTISITLSEDSISLGESVTMSGSVTAADDTTRANVNVTTQFMKSGAEKWTLLDTVETGSNGVYDYDWTPDETGTYKVKASWEGDEFTLGHESEVKTLEVKGAAVFPLTYVIAAVVAIIIIAAVVVYFVKIRKS